MNRTHSISRKRKTPLVVVSYSGPLVLVGATSGHPLSVPVLASRCLHTHEFPQPLTTVSEPCSCPALNLETERRQRLWDRGPHTAGGMGPEAAAPIPATRRQRNMAALLTIGGGRRGASLDWRNQCHVGSLVTRETSPLGTPLTTARVNNHPSVSL